MQIRLNEALNYYGDQLQNDADSVTKFTGFVWTEGRFVSKKYAVSKMSADSCGRSLSKIAVWCKQPFVCSVSSFAFSSEPSGSKNCFMFFGEL